jgi:CRP-like cAMP-binding protein
VNGTSAGVPANRLLATLPRKDRERFLSGCENVEMVFNKTIAEPGDAMPQVQFPTGGFISLLTVMPDGVPIEVALVGNEGMVGMPIFLGLDTSQGRFLVQGVGPALQMTSTRFRRELKASPALRATLGRYVHACMGQLAQTAGCNRFHVVEERLARWLLMTADRAHSPTFHITHEFLAMMLGVRRVGVTKAASELQRRKLISYSRGNIRVRDRAGLEAAACGCYKADLAIYARAFN